MMAMIATTAKSQLESMDEGYRIVTHGVEDCDFCKDTNDAYEPLNAEFTSLCTLENLTEYKLSPTRPGARQHALVIISGISNIGKKKQRGFRAHCGNIHGGASAYLSTRCRT